MQTTYGKVRGEFIHTLCELPSQTFLVCIKHPYSSAFLKRHRNHSKTNNYFIKSQYIQLDMEMYFSSIQSVSIHVNSGTHNTNANSYNTRAINSEIKWFYKMYANYQICTKVPMTPCQVTPPAVFSIHCFSFQTFNPNNLD